MVKKVLIKFSKQLSVRPLAGLVTTKAPAQALRNVISKDGLGVYASSDTLFRGAVFGRDSLEVAEDLMELKPKLVEKILITLASLQGESSNDTNEEEPGKIIHEFRRRRVDGKIITDVQAHIFDTLSRHWGGGENSMVYYGSIDSTPHFLKAIGTYCRVYGSEILTKEVILRSGRRASILNVVESALDWLIKHLDSSVSGLVEYRRRNIHGIQNQVWKDSKEFYVHESGLPANHLKPIASIEVQALAYDGLIYCGELLPGRLGQTRKYARQIQQITLGSLWLPQRNYFALGIDFDQAGHRRIIQTLTANPAALLDSLFFDDLGEKQKIHYVQALVREIMGTEFLTDAGIRSRALSEARLVPHWDYHGSYTSWPKETNDIAKGLRRQGFPRLAEQLENRLLNVIKAIKAYPEFIYVDPRGRVLGMASVAHTHGELVFVDSKNRPEKIQAWTVSAILAIKSSNKFILKPSKTIQQPWQADLEKEVLRVIPIVFRLRSRKELAARYPVYPYELKID